MRLERTDLCKEHVYTISMSTSPLPCLFLLLLPRASLTFIYTWILLWAEKSAGPQSGKIFRRIPKKTPETWKNIRHPRFWNRKNRNDKRLDHTQGNCLCATNSFSGAHSFHSPALEPSRSHCPCPSSEWPKSRTITKCKQLVPKQRLPRRNQGVCGKEPLFLCNRVSKVFCYKVGCSPCFFKACLRTAPPRK